MKISGFFLLKHWTLSKQTWIRAERYIYSCLISCFNDPFLESPHSYYRRESAYNDTKIALNRPFLVPLFTEKVWVGRKSCHIPIKFKLCKFVLIFIDNKQVKGFANHFTARCLLANCSISKWFSFHCEHRNDDVEMKNYGKISLFFKWLNVTVFY